MLNTNTAVTYLKKNEPQLFKFEHTLSPTQLADLLKQCSSIDLTLLNSQKKLLQQPAHASLLDIEPFDQFSFSGNLQNVEIGQRLIKNGRLGCVVLAGGQGSRLKFEGPKGCYPISIIKNKSLFQLIIEKVIAASQWAECPLNIAIMTSQENDRQTRDFFKKNHYFGLSVDQIDFFIQDQLPLLDSSSHLYLETASKIAMGSDGNGHSLLRFVESGIWGKWNQKGIEYLHLIPIDNPLADPFDAELLGFHFQENNEITLKCTEKVYPEEKVGVVVKKDNHCEVIEYSEIPSQEACSRRADGKLNHCCGNLSLFCFSLSFIKRIVEEKIHLPLHKAWKSAKFYDRENTVLSKDLYAWKFETFIFDWLKYSTKTSALLYPREECFAPLKNFIGEDSPIEVQLALQKKERTLIQTLTDLPAPNFPFELAAEFYYPTSALKEKWQGQVLKTSYAEP
ncbi:MAG: UTP--glucose-1-phosphate uridylyltransferase [Parachlamydiaceae bacterium]|nr:UTP--glucose-1-phosphate uridylyltransferase [Parachlamydiaceae bacterium]